MLGMASDRFSDILSRPLLSTILYEYNYVVLTVMPDE